MTTNITYIIYCNMMNYKSNYEAIHTVTVLEVYETGIQFNAKSHIITLMGIAANILLQNGIGFGCLIF